ncbi:YopX family protein [Streptococcus oralis]|uniref:TIGR01671 family protein n=1 Tax=Streptococcus mitis bv. 2 str. F0392 TaxID=768726 RepID=F9P1Q2_STROR|nr:MULTISPECIES: YopX family protein [Streptococcus]EGR92802.1 TIGR01671 family protein [Streptococcus mitis bv. 2 str. F0392]
MKQNFRAWYVLAEEMIDEILMISFLRKEIIGKFSNGYISVPLKFEDKRNGEDVILMQSTGLFDKNNKEIFEGDIVRQVRTQPTTENEIITGVVTMFEGAWLIMNDNDQLASYLWSETDENEIIGNIYENKDILEDGK